MAIVIIGACSAPLDENVVDVVHDTSGNYKFHYKTEESSKTEERKQDGFTSGFFSYTDPDGVLHVVHYKAGKEGVHVDSPFVPQPVQDTPEVAAAKAEHESVVKTIESLPEFEEDEHEEEVELTNEEFAQAISSVLNPKVLVFTADTPEIFAAKAEHLEAYRRTLGN